MCIYYVICLSKNAFDKCMYIMQLPPWYPRRGLLRPLPPACWTPSRVPRGLPCRKPRKNEAIRPAASLKFFPVIRLRTNTRTEIFLDSFGRYNQNATKTVSHAAENTWRNRHSQKTYREDKLIKNQIRLGVKTLMPVYVASSWPAT